MSSVGIQTGGIDALFSLILAGAIVVSMQVMGVTLIAAAIVIPPVTARLLTDDFGRFTILSVTIGAVCGFVGLYSSYYVDVSSGANIVLTMAAVFVVAMLWTSVRNNIPGLRRQPAGFSAQVKDPLLD